MDLLQAIEDRHSVRSYKDEGIGEDIRKELEGVIRECNKESGLNMQIIFNQPEAFNGLLPRYGSFKNVNNYIALVGTKDSFLEEKCGYYGEKVVLHAQQLGLNSCWVAGTYSKRKTIANIEQGEKLLAVIAIGYGENNGVARRTKKTKELCNIEDNPPQWFRDGIKAICLAPTATNQQKVFFEYKDKKVIAKAGFGFFTKIDLGICKYHFEIGAGKDNFTWSSNK